MKKRKRGAKRTDISGEKIKISKDEIKHINKSLRYGYRDRLCAKMGITQPTLCRYLKPQKIYNIDLKIDEEVYVLYVEDYQKILDFIKTMPSI